MNIPYPQEFNISPLNKIPVAYDWSVNLGASFSVKFDNIISYSTKKYNKYYWQKPNS